MPNRSPVKPPELARARKGCSWHRPHNLGYIAWHEDADARGKRGERQRRCPLCALYFWPDEFGRAKR